MRAAVERLMAQLRLPMNTEKTRCYRVPEEAMEFLGYRIGRTYRRDTGRAYLGTRPSAASVQSLCRRLSELTARGVRTAGPGGGGRSPQPAHDRVGELLHPGPSEPGLRRGGPARDPAVAPVAVS